jgi:hypothetical protein
MKRLRQPRGPLEGLRGESGLTVVGLIVAATEACPGVAPSRSGSYPGLWARPALPRDSTRLGDSAARRFARQ